MFFFEPFPSVEYDLLKNGKPSTITNIFLRYKITQAFADKTAVYYTYNIKDGERPDVIAAKYYEDASLDWVILLTNNIVDPQFDWPLSRQAFTDFIVSKYGSVSAANEQVHHYEEIVQQQQVLFDGTVLPEEYYEIDLTTYNTLPDGSKREVTAYEYEERINESKRNIKILAEEYVFDTVNSIREIFINA